MRLGWLGRAALVAGSLVLVDACGARTGLRRGAAGDGGGDGGGGGETPAQGGEGGSFEPECVTSADCPSDNLCLPSVCEEGRCVPSSPVDCSDADPCTKDSCDPATGACLHEGPIDADGDGYLSVTTGVAGCGDDCDDGDAAIHPAAPELCDGRDNDCDGAIDEGTSLGYAGFEPVRLSGPELERASRAGFSRSEGTLGVSYTGVLAARKRSYFTEIDPSGNVVTPAKILHDINADSYAGLLSWNGEYHASAWSDARQAGNYEIYFNRLTAQGDKLGADLRLSNAPDFSLHATLAQLDDGFLVAWDDRRLEDEGGPDAQIYAVVIGQNGSVSAEQILTSEANEAESPALARGKSRIGLAYTELFDTGDVVGRFKTFDTSLGAASNPVDFGVDVQDPSVAYAGGRFVVTWQTYVVGPGPSIMAALVSEDGVIEQPATAVTSGASYARTHTLLSLGDRLLLIWADDFDGNYELYSQLLAPDLSVLKPRERITFDPADTLWPGAVLTSDGGVGILFDDWRSGAQHVYYTRLECITP